MPCLLHQKPLVLLLYLTYMWMHFQKRGLGTNQLCCCCQGLAHASKDSYSEPLQELGCTIATTFMACLLCWSKL